MDSALNFRTDRKEADVTRLLAVVPTIYGTGGAFVLVAIYFLFLSLLNSPAYALQQFINLSAWFIPLVVGFGIQVALFFYMRGYEKLLKTGIVSKGSVVTSAGISSGSMIACCLHHAVEMLPLIGLSAVAALVTQFQSLLLGLGIVSNLLGVIYILTVIQKHQLYLRSGLISRIASLNLRLFFKISVVVSIVFLTFITVQNLQYY